MRNPSQDPIEYSQVTRQENTQRADFWRQGDRDESSSSSSARKLVRAVNTKTEFQNIKNRRKFSNICKISWESQRVTQQLQLKQWRPMYRYGDCSCLCQWKQPFILDQNYTENLEEYKDTNFEENQNIFNITQKLSLEHPEEILNVNTIESASPSWTRSLLSHNQDLMDRGKSTCPLRFCPPMFNDIGWTRKGNDGIWFSNSEKVKMYAKKFSQGYWTFLGPGDE